MKKKKNYEQPETAVTRVELESPICTGSTNFVGEGTEKQGVNINTQAVIETNKNDFSESAWGDPIN